MLAFLLHTQKDFHFTFQLSCLFHPNVVIPHQLRASSSLFASEWFCVSSIFSFIHLSPLIRFNVVGIFIVCQLMVCVLAIHLPCLFLSHCRHSSSTSYLFKFVCWFVVRVSAIFSLVHPSSLIHFNVTNFFIVCLLVARVPAIHRSWSRCKTRRSPFSLSISFTFFSLLV